MSNITAQRAAIEAAHKAAATAATQLRKAAADYREAGGEARAADALSTLAQANEIHAERVLAPRLKRLDDAEVNG